MKKRTRGATLIEILVVGAIVAIIAAAGLGLIVGAIDDTVERDAPAPPPPAAAVYHYDGESEGDEHLPVKRHDSQR